VVINLCAAPRPLFQILELVLNEQPFWFLVVLGFFFEIHNTHVIVTFFLVLRERTVCDKQEISHAREIK